MKVCSHCDKEKLFSDFHFRAGMVGKEGPGARRAICIACRKIYENDSDRLRSRANHYKYPRDRHKKTKPEKKVRPISFEPDFA